jgi:hypothetical protein
MEQSILFQKSQFKALFRLNKIEIVLNFQFDHKRSCFKFRAQNKIIQNVIIKFKKSIKKRNISKNNNLCLTVKYYQFNTE